MSDAKIYNLYFSLFFKIFLFGMFGLIIVMGIIFVVIGFFFSDGNSLLWNPGVVMIVIGGLNFYFIFSFPHQISVSETGEITFISLFRQRKIFISEIESIKPDPTQFFGFLVVRTQHKKIKILNQFDGFHDFIFNLKTNNPSIQFRGC
jgi:hypothetical protein